MNARPKRVPRLWCALQGLLPIDSCLVAQRAELAWPREATAPSASSVSRQKGRNRIAEADESIELPPRGSLRNQG
jgi:hypothetical protein